MRSYPRNSPQAACRLVGLMMLADGHVCRSELDALERVGASKTLGLKPGALPLLLHTLCEDLLANADGSGALLSSIDEHTLAGLLAEVDDPALRGEVIRLAEVVIDADGHMAEGEAWVLGSARRHWGLAMHVMRSDSSADSGMLREHA
jgi:uncharacterized tellurite resistance protein B-like protein